MKPLSLITRHYRFALIATGLTLVSCDRQKVTVSAQDQAEVEAARSQAAADKLAAQELRDEAERLRSEIALRQQINQLAEAAEKPEDPAPIPETSTPPVASTPTPRPPAMDAVEPAPFVRDDGAYQPFYNDLARDGAWMESPDYGYVFQPTISTNEDWAPYTDGAWSYTDYGWAWESQESFGHICYHYGRWTRLRSIGWVWVPGRQWAPAWVSWRSGNDCIGWAPLPPAAVWHGNLGIQTWVDGACHIAPSTYVFVTVQNFGHPRCRDVIYPRQRSAELFLQCRNVTRLTEVRTEGRGVLVRNEGPSVEILRPKLGDHFRERKIRFADRSADRPRVQTSPDGKDLVMGQWAFRKDVATTVKPATQKRLQAGIDLREETSPAQQVAMRKVLASEAKEALRDMSTLKPGQLSDRGPRPDSKSTRPQATGTEETPAVPEIAINNKTGRPLPPVQRQLEPLRKQAAPADGTSPNQPTESDPSTKPIRPNVVGNVVGNVPATQPQPETSGTPPPPKARPVDQSEPANISRVQQEDADRKQRALASQQKQLNALREQQTEAAQREAEKEQLAQVEARKQQEMLRKQTEQEQNEQTEARRQQAMAQRQAQEQQEKLSQIQQQQAKSAKQQAAAMAEQQLQISRRQQEDAARQQREQSNQRKAMDSQREQQEQLTKASKQQAELAEQQRQVSRRQQEDAERQQREQSNQRKAMDSQREQQANDAKKQEMAARELAAKQRDAEQRQAEQRQAQMEASRREKAEMAQRQAQQEAAQKQQAEQAQRQAQQEAMRKQQEEMAQRQAQQEAQRRQQAENAQRQAQQEAMQRKQEEAAQRQAQQEAQRRQQAENAQRQAQQEAMQRKQEEAAQRQAQQEANRRQQEQAEAGRRQQQEEANRRQQEASKPRSSGR